MKQIIYKKQKLQFQEEEDIIRETIIIKQKTKDGYREKKSSLCISDTLHTKHVNKFDNTFIYRLPIYLHGKFLSILNNSWMTIMWERWENTILDSLGKLITTEKLEKNHSGFQKFVVILEPAVKQKGTPILNKEEKYHGCSSLLVWLLSQSSVNKLSFRKIQKKQTPRSHNKHQDGLNWKSKLAKCFKIRSMPRE